MEEQLVRQALEKAAAEVSGPKGWKGARLVMAPEWEQMGDEERAEINASCSVVCILRLVKEAERDDPARSREVGQPC